MEPAVWTCTHHCGAVLTPILVLTRMAVMKSAAVAVTEMLGEVYPKADTVKVPEQAPAHAHSSSCTSFTSAYKDTHLHQQEGQRQGLLLKQGDVHDMAGEVCKGSKVRRSNTLKHKHLVRTGNPKRVDGSIRSADQRVGTGLNWVNGKWLAMRWKGGGGEVE